MEGKINKPDSEKLSNSPADIEHCLGNIALKAHELKVSPEVMKKIVASVATYTEGEAPRLQDVMDATELSRGSVHNGLRVLTDTDLLTRELDVASRWGKRGGKRPYRYRQTEKLRVAIEKIPEWRDSVRLSRVATAIGLDISDEAALSEVLEAYAADADISTPEHPATIKDREE